MEHGASFIFDMTNPDKTNCDIFYSNTLIILSMVRVRH